MFVWRRAGHRRIARRRGADWRAGGGAGAGAARARTLAADVAARRRRRLATRRRRRLPPAACRLTDTEVFYDTNNSLPTSIIPILSCKHTQLRTFGKSSQNSLSITLKNYNLSMVPSKCTIEEGEVPTFRW